MRIAHGKGWLRAIFSSALALSALVSLPVHGEILDQIVAVVNDEIITYSELQSILEPLYQKYEDVYSGPELFARLQEARWSMLNQLIEERLILQEVRKKELDIKEEVLIERMEEVESRFSSKEEFHQELARSDITLEEFREKEREKMMAYSMLVEEVSRRVMITPQDIISYYREHQDDYVEQEKAHFYQILIRKGNEDEDKRTIAKEVLERLEKGEDFKELARAYSEGPQRDKGGDWGFIKRGYLNPDTMGKIEESAFDLKPGGYSGIIETPIGYHIIMVEARKKEQTVAVSEVWSEIENRLYQQEAEKVNQEWITELKKKAYISIKQ